MAPTCSACGRPIQPAPPTSKAHHRGSSEHDRMTSLHVPGARLYYESRGRGPLMVMVPGANGSADVFRIVAEHLTAHYTVVIYDRRGFSRSRLDGPQEYDRRLETDADDVRRLIAHVSEAPATVFGAS